MTEDFLTSLTRQVKEEVLENYVNERRLIEAQIEDLEHLATKTRSKAVKAGRRLNRLALLMIRPETSSRRSKPSCRCPPLPTGKGSSKKRSPGRYPSCKSAR